MLVVNSQIIILIVVVSIVIGGAINLNFPSYLYGAILQEYIVSRVIDAGLIFGTPIASGFVFHYFFKKTLKKRPGEEKLDGESRAIKIIFPVAFGLFVLIPFAVLYGVMNPYFY